MSEAFDMEDAVDGALQRMRTPLHSIKVRTDVGGPYPVYETAMLDLMPDGSVRWRDFSPDEHLDAGDKAKP